VKIRTSATRNRSGAGAGGICDGINLDRRAPHFYSYESDVASGRANVSLIIRRTGGLVAVRNSSSNDALERIRAEYVEMPGMRLTAAQVQRLWGIDSAQCSSALAVLVRERFLCTNDDGTYSRMSDSTALRPVPVVRR
jgi:hypothetical protein